MSGEVFAWEHGLTVEGQRMPRLSYNKTHDFVRCGRDHGGVVDSRALVLATDYAALLAERDEIEAMNQQQALRLMEQESARIAAEAKLDAVTKDALVLQGRAQRAESLLIHCRNDMLDILASGRPTGSTDELTDEIAALTNPGHTNES